MTELSEFSEFAQIVRDKYVEVFNAFMEVGFTESEARELAMDLVKGVVNTGLKGLRM